MNDLGVIYMIHFTRPAGRPPRHYLGWTKDLLARLKRHYAGRGAHLTAAMKREGAAAELVLYRPGQTRSAERALKSRHQHARLCRICRPDALRKHREREQRTRATRTRSKTT